MSKKGVLFLAAGLLLAASAAAAQDRPIELGIDGGVQFKLNDPTIVTIAIPVSAVRVGFFTSDVVSFEPALSFNWLKAEGEDAITLFGGEIGVLYHFVADPDRARPYLRPFGGITLVGGGGDSHSQFHAGAGVGVKLPVVSHLAVRLEAQYQHAFDNQWFSARDAIGALIGFSFFTH